MRRGDYYFLDLNPDPGAALSVVCGGRELCDGSYLVDRPGFRYFSLEFVLSGQGTLSLSDRRFALGPGTVFFYGPEVPHQIAVDPGSSLVKYFVNFAGSEAAPLVGQIHPHGAPWVVSSPSWVQRLFEDLKHSADSLQESRNLVCSLILRQLLALLADRTLSTPSADVGLNRRFRTLKATLRDLALKGLSLEEATRACGVSPSYLSRLFRRFDTVTPHRFVVQCRMALAASLLQDPQLLIKEAALLTGYEDQYHFSRTFKSVYGHSPESFRRLRS